MRQRKLDKKGAAEKLTDADFSDRSMLIAYLEYALEDLKRIDKVSAFLVEAAIGNLTKRELVDRRH